MDRKKALGWYFIVGLLLGTGVMMKQHGVFFLALAPIYVLTGMVWDQSTEKKRRALMAVIILAGAMTPVLLAGLVFYLAGSFEKFWFWTVTYSRLYVSSPPLGIGLKTFYRKFTPIFLTGLPFWVFAAAGALLLRGAETGRERKAFAALFMVFSALAITPGLYFREHYFILTLPAASLLAGLGLDRLCNILTPERQKGVLTGALLLLILTVPILVMGRGPLFIERPEAVSRTIFGPNPFPESIRIASYLRERTTSDDTIAVLGSEPQIYFYSRRASATPFIYTYPLMENQPMALEMQKEMIGDIQKEKPRYILYVDIYNSWLRGRRSVGLIFDWFRFYWPSRYELVGIVEISRRGTRYVLGDEALYAPVTPPNSVLIYRRKEDA